MAKLSKISSRVVLTSIIPILQTGMSYIGIPGDASVGAYVPGIKKETPKGSVTAVGN